MKAFARRYRGYLWWLAGLAVFFAAYFSFRNSRPAMNWLCGRIVLPFEQAVGRLCGLTSVSVAEVLILSGIYIVIFYLAWQLRCLLTRPHKGRRLCRVGLTALCTALSVYAGFCLLWGVFYGADSFQDRSGLTARGGTAEELGADGALCRKGIRSQQSDTAGRKRLLRRAPQRHFCRRHDRL